MTAWTLVFRDLAGLEAEKEDSRGWYQRGDPVVQGQRGFRYCPGLQFGAQQQGGGGTFVHIWANAGQ